MHRSRRIALAVTASVLIIGSFAAGTAAQAAGPGVLVTQTSSSAGITFPTFPPPPTFPPFGGPLPTPTPIDRSTSGSRSIVGQLAPGGSDNDGKFDINQFDYHITALIVHDVLTAHPNGPAAILADGTRPATFFEPSDGEWVKLARKLTGQALPLPSATTEQTTYGILKSLGISRLEKVLTYLIIPGITLTVLGPPTISQATYVTANGETLLIKSNFGVITLVDNNPLTSNSGVIEAPMNQGNKQFAWSSAVLLPSTY